MRRILRGPLDIGPRDHASRPRTLDELESARVRAPPEIPEVTSALQCDSLSVEQAQQHHGPIKRYKQLSIGGEGRERPVYRAIWREVIAAAHLEARDDGKFFARLLATSLFRSDPAPHAVSFCACAETMQYRGGLAFARVLSSLLQRRFMGLDAIVDTLL